MIALDGPLAQGPGTPPPEPDPLALALDCSYSFTTGGSGGQKWGTQDWLPYYGPTMAEGDYVGDDEETWMQTTVTASAGDKVFFYWKVSSEQGDYLKFYIDQQYQAGISGSVDWQKKSYSLGAGSHTLKWVYVRDSSGYAGANCGWVDGLSVGTESLIPQPDSFTETPYAEVLDCDLKLTSMGDNDALWYASSGPSAVYYLDGDSAQSGSISDEEESCLQTIVESSSAETIKFYWKVSSEQDSDYLQFYIDSTLKDQISGSVGWQEKSYSVTSGTHILKWRYVKDSSGSSGSDCGWVDFVQWSGPSPTQNPSNWQEITYKHDATGQRAEKKVDGYTTRYVRDGRGSVLAEYDGNNNLLRKYIAGPGGPVCMIEVADSNAVYYYHQDGRGSIVALSDANGDTVQTYEYSVFGEVAVSDANHPNPYMFGGMRFEVETGLYYLGGPVYNPYIGRMLQQNFGIHWERYSWADVKSGLADEGTKPMLTFVQFASGDYGFIDLDEDVPSDAIDFWKFDSIEDWLEWAPHHFDEKWMKEQNAYALTLGSDGELNDEAFWGVEALIFLGYEFNYASVIGHLKYSGVKINTITGTADSMYVDNTVIWNTETTQWREYADNRKYCRFHPLVMLAHELGHAYDDHTGAPLGDEIADEQEAVAWENLFRWLFYKKVPGYQKGDDKESLPRPAYGWSRKYPELYPKETSAEHPDLEGGWDQYWGEGLYGGHWMILP